MKKTCNACVKNKKRMKESDWRLKKRNVPTKIELRT